jgi:hypothetical protein
MTDFGIDTNDIPLFSLFSLLFNITLDALFSLLLND